MANGGAAKAATKTKQDGFFVKVIRFIREAYVETRLKSAWPTWQELRQFTIVVIFAVLVVSFWIGGIDVLLTRIVDRFLR